MFILRQWFQPTESDFVYSTWIKSYRSSGAVRGIPTPLYNRGQRARIARILKNHDTLVTVVAPQEEPELILGYLVQGQPNILHYIYVKKNYRNAGIARILLEPYASLLEDKQPLFYTHKSSQVWIEKRLIEDPSLTSLVYNPYCLEVTNELHS